MIEELRRLERRRGRTGKDSIDHPPHLSDDLANAVAGAIDLVITKAPKNKNAIPIGVGHGLGAELRQAFGPLAMDKPFPDSTLGPAPAEERLNTGCAILYGFDFGDNSEGEPGGYISQTGRRKKFPSRE